MDREAFDRWCERGILVLTLSMLVLMPLAFGGRPQEASGRALDFWLLDPFVLAEWLLLGVLGLWGLRLWLAPKFRFLLPPISWAVLAFAGYAVARYLTADIEYLARQELIRILVYAFMFLAIVNNLHRQESIQILTVTLVFLAMAESCYAIYQFLSGSDRVWHLFKPVHDHRGGGTYISPNHLAGFLEMLLPLGLAYTLMGRFKPLTKVLLGYASLVIMAGIAVTVSRGGWVSSGLTVCGFFAVMLTQRAFRLPALALLVLLVGAAAFLAPKSEVFMHRTRALFNDGRLDDDARFALWGPAYRVWQDNLWWGSGPDHYDYRFKQYRPPEIQLRADRAHNDYLNLLADWGLVGFVLVAAAWGLLAAGVWKTWGFVRKNPRDLGGSGTSTKFAFVVGATLGLLAILLHSTIDFNMHIPANALLAVALMAMLSSCLRFATESYWFTARVWSKVLVSAVLVAGLVYLGRQSCRHAREDLWLARAAVVDPFSPEQEALLKKAVAAEPDNPGTAWRLGENLRVRSEAGGKDSDQLAREALPWFEQARKLNPWDGAAALGCGWCLDWLDRSAEAAVCFQDAERLDPNNYFVMSHIGHHYIQAGNLAAARPWLERSLDLLSQGNPFAERYLEVVNRSLLAAATNDLRSALLFSAPAGTNANPPSVQAPGR